MRRLKLLLALSGAFVFCTTAYAQSAPVQLCVAGLQMNGMASSSASGRDMLIAALNKQKSKGISIEKVPLLQAVPADALTEAKEKKCDYVVTVNETDSHNAGSVIVVGGSGMVNRQTYYVTLAYKLTKVADGADASSGTIKASDETTEQNALASGLKKVADKVSDTIKKAGPVSK